MLESRVRRALLASFAAITLLPTPAHADPIITPLILAGLASAGLSGTTAAVAASIISAVVVTGIGIGLSLLFGPKPPKPENGQVAVQEPIGNRIYGYGTARVPGQTVFKEQANGFLGVVNVLNGHRVDSVQAVYLNDDLVQLYYNGALVPNGQTSSSYGGFVGIGGDGRYEKNRVTIDTRIGVVPETPYSQIVSQFGDVWTTSCRGDGCASLMMLCAPAPSKEFGTTYPYGAPQPSAVVNQAQVYDWRTGTQSSSDPNTWHFSRNPVLCLAHFECFSEFGPRRLFSTAILPILDQWTQAANDCDVAVALKSGGNEPRYQLGGYTTTGSSRDSTVQAILTTCDGWLCERGDGTLGVQVGVYRPPTVTLTDADVLGFLIQRDVASEDVINQATCKYTYPDAGYVTVETDPQFNTTDVTTRPGPPRTSQLDAGWVQSAGQASRLLVREMVRQQEKTRGTLTCRLSAVNAQYERFVRVTSNTIPRLSNQVVEVQKATFDILRQQVTIQFIGSGPELDVYNPQTQESSPPTIVTRAASLGLPVPANVSAVPKQFYPGQAASDVYLEVSWDVPVNSATGTQVGGLSYNVQYRTSDTGNGAGAWVSQEFDNPTIVGSRIVVDTSSVPKNAQLDVEVSTLGTTSLSTFSPVVTVNTKIS